VEMKKENQSRDESLRYLLVRPLGGLNDVLCQIEYARMLALETKRILVIQSETGNPSLKHGFVQSFDSIFSFSDKKHSLPISELPRILSASPTIYPSYFSDPQDLLSESLSQITKGEVVKFKLADCLEKKETVVVHESDGGGLLSSYLFGHIVLQPRLEEIAGRAISLVPPKALGLHFRNSDYKSDKSELDKFVSLAKKNEVVLLATDDPDLRTYLGDTFPGHNIVFTRDLIGKLDSLSPTELAVVELFLLGACSHLALVPLSESEDVNYSGYGLLARQLWVVRKGKTEGLLRLALALSRFSRPTRPLTFIRNVVSSTNLRVVVSQLINTRGVFLQLEKLWRGQGQGATSKRIRGAG